MLVISLAAVLVPLAVSVVVATVVVRQPSRTSPTVGTFGRAVPRPLPAFYIALTVGLGTAIKSTAGVAGVAFAVMFVPQVLGGLLPIVGELSPTSIGVWAMADRKGRAGVGPDPGRLARLDGVIVVGAKLVFDRQEF